MITTATILINETDVIFYAMRYMSKHGRNPKVSELPYHLQVLLGKKIFEFLDYRDEYSPKLTDEFVYCGCLADHGIDRDRPDGVDVAKRRAYLRGEISFYDYYNNNSHLLTAHFAC